MSRLTFERDIKPGLNAVNSMQNLKKYIIRYNGNGYTITSIRNEKRTGYTLNSIINERETGESYVYNGNIKEVYSFLKGMVETYRVMRETQEN